MGQPVQIQVIQVPYDSGHRGVRMGRGPEHFVQRGLEAALRARGHEVRLDSVEPDGAFQAEIRTAFELHRHLAARVRLAVDEGQFPLVLAGNCNSALGTLAGVGAAQVGVIWLDAHGDFNTPETTTSGFLDGMALATLTGRCWRALAAAIPGFSPVPDAHVIHVGGRDFDLSEWESIGRSEVTVIGAELVRTHGVRDALERPLGALGARVQRVYLHIDLDVLDPGEAPANEFAPPSGLTSEQVEQLIRMVGARFTICAAALTAYDPAYDQADRAYSAGVRLVEIIASTARC